MQKFLGKYSDLLYGVMRIVVGLLFACHGAQKILGMFGGMGGEGAKRAERLAVQREHYREELVEGPVLVLDLPERRLLFNPNTVVPLGDEGYVYPGSILIGPWGRLALQEGAALATPSRDRARVAAPEALEPGRDGAVNGPGWILELAPGWRIVPGPRPGDFRLDPDPGG